jgi:Protein of unknown function (DUF1326)
MAGLAPLIGEMLEVERALTESNEDGLRHNVHIGNMIHFEIGDIVPFGVETGRSVSFSEMFHPAGSDLIMAQAKRSRISAHGIQYEGKTGLSKSDFSWPLDGMSDADGRAGPATGRTEATALSVRRLGRMITRAAGAPARAPTMVAADQCTTGLGCPLDHC